MDFYDAAYAGLFRTHVEIIPSSKIIGHGWDLAHLQELRFHNFKKLLYFARYYSRCHDVLVKIYLDNKWFATYCNGKEISNCW